MSPQLKINFRPDRESTALSVSFSLTPSSGSPPLEVSFTITSMTGAIDSYEWDFGDGTTFTGADAPAHTYTVDGVYTVTLTVTGPAGTASESHNVTVVTGGGGGAPYDNIVDAFALIQDGAEHTKDFDNTGATMQTNEETNGEGFQGVWAILDLTDYAPGCGASVTFKTEFISGNVVPRVDFWDVVDDTFNPAAPDFFKLHLLSGVSLGDGTNTPLEQTFLIDPLQSLTAKFYLWIGDWFFIDTDVGVQRLTYSIQPKPDASNQVLRADATSGASASARKNFSAQSDVWVTAKVAFTSCAAEHWRSFGSANLFEINSGGGSTAEEGITIHRDGFFGGAPIAWESSADFDHAQTPVPTGEQWMLLEMHWNSANYELTAYVDTTQIWTWDFGSAGPDITGITVGQSGTQSPDQEAWAYINDVKVGTSRGGTEIFSDGFSSGDLSNWDIITGSVDVGPDPFPAVPPSSGVPSLGPFGE